MITSGPSLPLNNIKLQIPPIMRKIQLAGFLGLVMVYVISAGCTPAKKTETATGAIASVAQKPFGTARDGKAVTLYTLRNRAGASMSVMNYGGIITTILMPD